MKTLKPLEAACNPSRAPLRGRIAAIALGMAFSLTLACQAALGPFPESTPLPWPEAAATQAAPVTEAAQPSLAPTLPPFATSIVEQPGAETIEAETQDPPLPTTAPVELTATPYIDTHPPAPPPVSGPRLVGYFASWSIYARGYPARSIPADKLTHVNYAFAIPSEDGECVGVDPSADEVNFPELQTLKQAYPHLKTLISVGGAGTSGNFSQAAETETNRQRFVQSCVRFMQENGFDGIDIDWEYPEPEESENFTELLAELRRQLDRQGESDAKYYSLTIAAGASPYQYYDIALGQIEPYLDWFNLMTYDFHGPWSGLTGFNSPLYASSKDEATSELERLTFNIHSAVQAFLAAGVPPEKIVVGAPFYARVWGEVNDNNQGLYQPFGQPPENRAHMDYYEVKAICLAEDSGYTRYWDEEAQVPWLYHPENQIMVSYDDPYSLALKAAYILDWQLGGIMVWHLAADDAEGSLLDALHGGLYGLR